MSGTRLSTRRCSSCDGKTPVLGEPELRLLSPEVPAWRVDGKRLVRSLEFSDFGEAMRFVNGMAEVAEAEGHHPDFSVHYRRVEVVLWTHVAGGLTENDFILAAKLDALLATAFTG